MKEVLVVISKMKKLMTILTVFTVLIFSSCGTKQNYGVEKMSADFDMEISASQNSEQQPLSDNIETIERKIIKQGDIRFETEDVNLTKSLITQKVKELNGYIATDYIYNYSDRLENSLTIRVPADKFDLLLASVTENIEKLDRKSINMLDVTEEYIDIEIRIKTKKELQNRYIELLKQAKKVDEILNIEKEIGTLQTEIESVEGRLKYLKDRIIFSTLTVSYYQNTSSEFGFISKFLDGIKSGWSVFLWFVVGLSHLWVFILVSITVIYLIILRRKKKHK